MRTEDEAKKRWCPFSRVGVTTHAYATPINRLVSPSAVVDERVDQRRVLPAATVEVSPCIGSECMAWRWLPLEDAVPGQAGSVTVQDMKGLRPDLAPYHEHDSGRRFMVRGYCGLAGKPDA